MQKLKNDILTQLELVSPANFPPGGGTGRDGPVVEHPPETPDRNKQNNNKITNK